MHPADNQTNTIFQWSIEIKHSNENEISGELKGTVFPLINYKLIEIQKP